LNLDLNLFEAVAAPRVLNVSDDSIITPELFEAIKDSTLLC
jgi:hypothetical protein